MQKVKQNFIDVQNSDVWKHSDLILNDNGYVSGVAYTKEQNGYSIEISVFTYEYEQNGETKMNHVPNIILSNKNGSITAEPHAHDSQNAEKAIQNAINTGEYVIENLNQFV